MKAREGSRGRRYGFCIAKALDCGRFDLRGPGEARPMVLTGDWKQIGVRLAWKARGGVCVGYRPRRHKSADRFGGLRLTAGWKRQEARGVDGIVVVALMTCRTKTATVCEREHRPPRGRSATTLISPPHSGQGGGANLGVPPHGAAAGVSFLSLSYWLDLAHHERATDGELFRSMAIG